MASKTATTSIYAIPANEKSAGKSTIMNVYADMMRETSAVVHLYDPDETNGSFQKRQGTRDEKGNLLPNDQQDPAKGCFGYDLTADGSRDTFVNCLERTPKPKVIIADNGAKSRAHLTRLVDNGAGVDALCDVIEEQGFKLTILHAISPLTETTASVMSYLELFGNRANHIAVLNKHYGANLGTLNMKSADMWGVTKGADGDDELNEDPAKFKNAAEVSKWGKSSFPYWFGHREPESKELIGWRTRDKLLDLGGVEITFPAMNPEIYARLMASDLSFKAAATSPRFTLLERKNIKTFNDEARASFMTVKEMLGL